MAWITSSFPFSFPKGSSCGTSRSSNEVVCVDHFWIDYLCLFYAIYTYLWLSVAFAVPNAELSQLAFGSGNVLAQFSHSYCAKWCCLLPSCINSLCQRMQYLVWSWSGCKKLLSLLQPKHGVMWAMYLPLQSGTYSNPCVHSDSAVCISNALYRSEILLSVEIAKGRCKPIDHQF